MQKYANKIKHASLQERASQDAEKVLSSWGGPPAMGPNITNHDTPWLPRWQISDLYGIFICIHMQSWNHKYFLCTYMLIYTHIYMYRYFCIYIHIYIYIYSDKCIYSSIYWYAEFKHVDICGLISIHLDMNRSCYLVPFYVWSFAGQADRTQPIVFWNSHDNEKNHCNSFRLNHWMQ